MRYYVNIPDTFCIISSDLITASYRLKKLVDDKEFGIVKQVLKYSPNDVCLRFTQMSPNLQNGIEDLELKNLLETLVTQKSQKQEPPRNKPRFILPLGAS